ncbi:unnamed protein product [Paramecium sonneborni]|uniref:Insulin-like growth factor binding protein, N-terminal n=1 Tax=Paramecium sonneborni TaxID=65129 RepID=A0A8S1RNP9_9CILI|nr:unnamed protein product [Paramecium sonneborni]
MLLVLQSANSFLHSIYEEFNNKKISLANTKWICDDYITHPTQVFTCSKGMDLVILEQKSLTCHKIVNKIDTTWPHFRIQLYVDVYSYNTIDGNDYFWVGISEIFLSESLCISPYNPFCEKIRQLKQCSSYNQISLIRKSYFKEVGHSQQQVSLEIRSEADQSFDDESYLFRNVQIILDRCYKTCKTCSGEGKEQCLSCYDDIVLSSNNSCDSCKNKMVDNFLQIPDGCRNKCNNNYDYDEDQVCFEDINLQVKCEVDCELCTNTQRCLICKTQKYLYFGQCIDQCPKYTIVYGTNCLSDIDILLKNKNLRITELVREFHDLSTTKRSINAIFQITSTNNQHSFQKGNDIYYSYFSNKRIFGGPLVWVNAIFKFTKSWNQEFQYIKIFFEVILGDIELDKNIFTYKINDQQQETITLNSTFQGNNPNIEDQIWPNDYKFNIYKVEKSINNLISTNKQLTMEIMCQNINELGFCGIQNMVVIGFSNCEPEYNFGLFNYETGRNPCIPICGDKIIVGDEECDDGNNDPFDGCFNCRYQCEEHCSDCLYGQCIGLQCTIYVRLFVEILSIKVMNNVMMVTQNYDGCSNCQLIQYDKCDLELDIQNYHCAVCHYGKCIKCNEGLLLDGDICVSICGDGLLNLLDEECDVQRGDGCIDCKIQDGYVCGKQNYSICKTCDIECTQCFSLDKINLICQACIDGYYPVEDKCQLCDLNCITCKQQSNLCTSCYRPDCEYCESIPGLFGDKITKKCNSICGDGILVESYEQCDDYNLNDGDGCDSQCNLEYSDNSINQIKYYQSLANNTYDLKLITQQPFQFQCNIVNITIENMDSQDYHYNCTQVDTLTCRLQFDFKKSIYKFNIIHVKLGLTNSIIRLLLENEKSIQFDITPNELIILTQDQTKQSEQIKGAQQSFNFVFLIMIPISIIFNLFNYLWAVLEILMIGQISQVFQLIKD